MASERTKPKGYPKHAPDESRYRSCELYIASRGREGATETEIAEELGISRATLQKWHPRTMTRGKYTDEMRRSVERMAGLGMTDEMIASVVGIGEDALQNNFRAELSAGRAGAADAVLSTLYNMATSGEHPHTTEFWVKARLGWRDKDSAQTAVQVNAGDGPVQVNLGGRRLAVDDDGLVKLADGE